MARRISQVIYRGGNQRIPEFHTWASLVAGLGARSYVELGCGSANWITQLPGMEKVITVDILPNGMGGITHVNASSHDPGTLTRVLDLLSGSPDIVFIDADHSALAAQQDFDLWWPYAQIAVGFHDILMPSVADYWNQLRLRHPSIEIIARDVTSADLWQRGDYSHTDGWVNCGGIGCIFKGNFT